MYVAHSREDGIYQPLKAHLEGTADLAAAFAGAFGAEAWGRAVGLCHDLGKTADAVQRRIMGNGPKVDHATAGAIAVLDACGLLGAYCVAGHHGRIPDGGIRCDPDDVATLYGRIKRTELPCDRSVLDEMPPNLLASGLPLKVPEVLPFRTALFIRMLTSCLVDADRLDTEAYANHGRAIRGGYDDIPTLHARLTAHLDAFGAPDTPINTKRTAIRHACVDAAQQSPGLFSLTVPTGGGKTLSSMAFALEHAKKYGYERIIYVIPYVSIIEQNADVFRRALGSHNVVEHHANFAFDDDDAWHVRQRLSTENWDAPVIVTTNVQFFQSLFSARSSQLRKIHSLAKSVILFDEAQMIPLPYLIPCVEAIGELVRNYDCSAVLMSATQPALAPYLPADMPLREMMPDPEGLYAFFRRTTLSRGDEMPFDELINQLSGHAQVLCIVNTRKLAQRAYEALQGEGTYHLSTLMYPIHRSAVLAEIRARLAAGLPCRVVSTSLIEAGVDVSFPVVYREEAGLDSVIQAAGRCNREGKWPAEASVVHVFRLAGADRSRPPASTKQSMYVAKTIFDAYADAASLEAIHAYFQGLYGIKGDTLDQKRIMDMTAWQFKELSIPFREIEKAFQLIESNTYSVAIAVTEEAQALVDRLEAGEHTRDVLRQLGRYSVNIYKPHLDALTQAGAVTQLGEDGWVLRGNSHLAEDAYYSGSMGLKLDVDTGFGIMI